MLKPEVGDDRDWIGLVVEEHDPRGGTRKRIYAVEDGYALCRAGGLGDGRKSKVRIDRLYSARYTVVSKPREPTCRCDGSGVYRAELPDSGDTGSTYVKCPCGASDRRLAARLTASEKTDQ